ncbi:xanthine dehydrogenase/oxidase-like isoform X2 [Apostichopus japonicus]|uniref:xanthine dehydrogenase/oxidase-like isoform X2 n=1 Tax=Stichopus japonicus TaxID=307972 RepID=UPI003AB7295F
MEADGGSKYCVFYFFCNGKKISDPEVDPSKTLSSYLRLNLDLKGTKVACQEGGCGACTVMVSSVNVTTGNILHTAVNSCLTPICSVYGMAITTIEGIGSVKKLHPVQERIAKAHGSQCGFCTPGFVMSMYTLLRNNPEPTMEEIETAIEGNLCRCTGYRPIIEGFRTFTKGNCDQRCTVGRCCQDNLLDSRQDGIKLTSTLFRPQEFIPYDPTQDIIFPPELMINQKEQQTSDECLIFTSRRVKWLRPLTLKSLLQAKERHPSAKLVIGNTDVGVEVKYSDKFYPIVIHAKHIPEMNQLKSVSDGIFIGSAITVTKLTKFIDEQMSCLNDSKATVLQAIKEMLSWFAGMQIRNVASVGGNIMSASPVSDLTTLFMASGATLHVASIKGSRTLALDDKFLIGQRKTAVRPNEVLIGVQVPFTKKNEFFYSFKQSRRKEDPVAVVKAGMMVAFKENTNVVSAIRVAFAGVAETVKLAERTMSELVGKAWTDDLLTLANKKLLEDYPLTPEAAGGMTKYRHSLVLGFFFKFYLRVLMSLNNTKIMSEIQPIPETWHSAVDGLSKRSYKSTQLFQEVPSSQSNMDPVGRPIVTISSIQQATGEARYLDDIPEVKGTLYLALVQSRSPHGIIRSIDFEAALSVEGVVDVVTAKDVPGRNTFGILSEDEELFATEKVHCIGQTVAGVLAKDEDTARRAAKLVKVEYENLEPVFTIKEAIAKGNILGEPVIITSGDPDNGLEMSDHVIEGEIAVGAQEHFYMETQRCMVIPQGEHDEIEVILSTQCLSPVQAAIVSALGIPSNRIVCKSKRVGGAFGGKAYRSTPYATVTAVAAVKVGSPVRLILDRHEDMISSGTRHPYLVKYKVGFTDHGRLTAVDVTYYANIGFVLDISQSVMVTSLLKFENAYKIPNVRVTGIFCRTNIPSCTAFRAFGAPQAMIATETWMNDIARICGISPEKVRELNFYKEGDATHHSQVLHGVTLSRCWEQCLTQSNLATRRISVDNFNKDNRWKKRGLAIVPVKYGIAYIGLVKFMNQGGACVHIYKDGAVLLSHGGIEIGQGMYTKMHQVASRTLGIPMDKFHTIDTATDKVPNTSGTAASTGTDLNGMAVKNACLKIMDRLKPIVDKNPSGTWEDWISEAYHSRISLSATGFWRTPDLGYDLQTNQGNNFNYFCYGAAASEVEIDCLTGDHVTLRTDIVMDVGDSLNPAIDVGQIEGAFMQGYGLFLLEDYRINSAGQLLTIGPSAYKIPTVRNTPVEFNVSLLHNAANPRSVYSSKGVGEPPLFLASSVYFAVKEAISSARLDAHLPVEFRLDSPAIPERIRLACQDSILGELPEEETSSPFFLRP